MAEWGREARRRQTGLLLTAHRAKGLEFDHVVVLDGDWLRSGANEDADATRRLYYVAMTRARKTLALARYRSTSNRKPTCTASKPASPPSMCADRGTWRRLTSPGSTPNANPGRCWFPSWCVRRVADEASLPRQAR